MSDTAIKLTNISKTFKLPHEKQGSLKSAVVNFYRRKRTFEVQKAIEDISFEVKKGEFFGVVGRNGSGKSTLLKLLAGIYSPDKGTLEVNGKLTPFIELGVGFNPELTGRENVFLNGALLGLNRKETRAIYDDIVAFADLERFMDQKLKNYSSGMQVRLAFSIAIRAKSDILLLDEVLAVGDSAFQKKCFDHFRKLKKDKKTVVFISHDMNAIREYCDRAALVDNGLVVRIGKSEDIAQDYTKMFMNQDTGSVNTDGSNRWGSQKASIKKFSAKVTDKTVTVNVEYDINENITDPIFGLTITSPVGIKVFESNTKWKKIKTGKYYKDTVRKTSWEIPNIFTNGTNYITGAIADSDGLEFFDWWEDASSFIVDKDTITTAVTLPDFKVQVE